MGLRWTAGAAAALAMTAVVPAAPRGQAGYTTIAVTLPSAAGGAEGLAVQVAAPQTSRYADGAPVVIFVQGGGRADAFNQRANLTEGALEITFAFPTGALGGRTSGGTYDQRGPLSQRALADVVRYALGQAADAEGRLLRDLVSYPVLSTNVGLVGWSRGGDSVVTTLARHADDTRGVAWVVIHESPLFDNAVTGEIAWQAGKPGPAADYVTGTCALLACQVLYPRLAWDAAAGGGGALYLDRSGNGRLDSSSEVALPSTGGQSGLRYHTVAATEAAAAAGVFGSAWPDSVATPDQAAEYWGTRDARYHFAAMVAGHPSLAAIIHATSTDHVQTSADHAHVALAYNALHLGGARFVRMNPDRAYTESFASGLPDNSANADLPSDFSSWLVPESSIPDPLVINAAILELVDRTHAGRWEENVGEVVRGSERF